MAANDELYMKIAMISLALLFAVFIFIKVIIALTGYFREKKYILMEINRADNNSEYLYFRRELSYLRLCLIPFVNERNVQKAYLLFHREQKAKTKSLFLFLAPAVIGAAVCLIIVSGLSWAWFTDSSSASAQQIKSASFGVSIKAGESELGETGGKYIFEATSSETTTFTVTKSSGSSADSGFCIIEVKKAGESVTSSYITENLASIEAYSFSFSGAPGDKVTITPKWGDPGENRIASGLIIGKKNNKTSSFKNDLKANVYSPDDSEISKTESSNSSLISESESENNTFSAAMPEETVSVIDSAETEKSENKSTSEN